ncbi:MAG: ferrous iron transport protein A [Opitutales bacterium]|nr:ferrous iron transport protein A [Opitutales bacterium]
MEKLLSEFSPNEVGRVVKILGEGRLRRRILDMGITPEAEIVMRKSAPLGDPIEVSLRGYELSLRKAEASLIKMRVEK